MKFKDHEHMLKYIYNGWRKKPQRGWDYWRSLTDRVDEAMHVYDKEVKEFKKRRNNGNEVH